jgi:hypothetical protein
MVVIDIVVVEEDEEVIHTDPNIIVVGEGE